MTIITTLRAGSAALALAAALPAAAQDFCGGLSANGQWIGGDEAASDVAAATGHLEQLALVLQGNEYIALFSLSAPAEVRLEAEGRGAGDPVLELLDEGGAVVGADDDSGGNSASRIETALAPGRYCLRLTSFDGTPMTGFVRAGRLEHEALTDGLGTMPEPDPFASPAACDLAAARELSPDGGPADAAIAAGGLSATASAAETPFWRFSLAAEQPISITAENEAADPYITLYDEFGNWIGENDDFDGLNARIDLGYPVLAGTYCLQLTALGDASQPVTLTLAAYDAAAAIIGMYNRGEAAPPLDGSHPVTAIGLLGSRLRSDIQSTDVATWYSFEIGEPGLVLIEAVTNGMGDPTLALFDDFGREVAYNDDAGGTLDSLVAARVMPGTYLVAVRQLNAGPPVLTRLLFERYIPAR
jgi:hypothetical protein